MKFKSLCILIISIIINSSCSKNKSEPFEVLLSIKNQTTLNHPLELKSYRAFDVELIFNNNTDSLIKFWAMNCSWQENFLFKKKNTMLYSPGCDQNYPKLYVVDPFSKKTFKSTLIITDSIFEIQNIKIGFVLINEADYNINLDFREVLSNFKKNSKNIIWSK